MLPFWCVQTLLPDGRQRVSEYFSGLNADFASFTAIKLEAQAVYDSPDTLLPRVPAFLFRDYVLAERASRETERGTASWTWWLRRVQTYPPALSMPLVSTKQKVGRSVMGTLAVNIPGEQWSTIERRCEAFDVSPSICFYGALPNVTPHGTNASASCFGEP